MTTQCPHICVVYGGASCRGVAMRNSGHITNKLPNWESNKKITKQLHYMFCNIPSLTLTKWSTSGIQLIYWKVILFQLFFTMTLLRKYIPGFVHHELISKNVYLQKVKPGGQFVYVIHNKKYFVPNIGVIVKVAPCVYNHATSVKNTLMYDNQLQDERGYSPSNTAYYDLHSFCNSVTNMKSANPSVVKWMKTLFPDGYMARQNNMFVYKQRLRNGVKCNPSLTFSSLLGTGFFKCFHKINKRAIVFYPTYRV